MSDIDFLNDFDLPDLQDDNDETVVPNVDESKLDRELLSKSVLIDYIRERIKQKHSTRLYISSEGENKLLKFTEDKLRQFLDILIDELVPLVELSLKKTIFPRHVSYAKSVLTRLHLYKC